jgi:DNA sulfur modification protein DndB
MKRRYLPALRGIFGDWAYYVCLMSLREVSQRVSFAKDIHESKALSDLIQRELKEGRAKDIAHYLVTNEERFFNSLVVAVYGGDPAWHQLDEITPRTKSFDIEAVSEDAVASLGFLSFTGEEDLFALDGQHRLAGIQLAITQNPAVGDDEASVIFVAHKKDTEGKRRTRRLFTTLNKTAVPVNKGEIIALDESDVMAIVVRDLVEQHRYFSEDRILVAAQTNLPPTDNAYLTTIVNLYDVLTVLFSKVMTKQNVRDLQYNRPPDEELDEYRAFALRYFTLLSGAFPALKEYFTASKPKSVVKKYRRSDGGHVLFRPVGMTIFVNLAASLMKSYPLDESMELLARLPTELKREPYVDLLWDSSTRTLDLKRQVLVRRILQYMLGVTTSRREVEKLKADIAKVRDIAVRDVTLPRPVQR